MRRFHRRLPRKPIAGADGAPETELSAELFVRHYLPLTIMLERGLRSGSTYGPRVFEPEPYPNWDPRPTHTTAPDYLPWFRSIKAAAVAKVQQAKANSRELASSRLAARRVVSRLQRRDLPSIPAVWRASICSAIPTGLAGAHLLVAVYSRARVGAVCGAPCRAPCPLSGGALRDLAPHPVGDIRRGDEHCRDHVTRSQQSDLGPRHAVCRSDDHPQRHGRLVAAGGWLASSRAAIQSPGRQCLSRGHYSPGGTQSDYAGFHADHTGPAVVP